MTRTSLLKETVDDLLFSFFLCKTESHKLDKLLACDSADCSLVNEGCIGVVCVDFGDSRNNSRVHDNSVALTSAVAEIVAVDAGSEKLLGVFLCNRTGNNVCVCVFTIKCYFKSGSKCYYCR